MTADCLAERRSVRMRPICRQGVAARAFSMRAHVSNKSTVNQTFVEDPTGFRGRSESLLSPVVATLYCSKNRFSAKL
jgi:hypothetical protein